MDYSLLESDFDCACGDVIKKLSEAYRSGYHTGSPGMLEAFLDLIKSEFEKAEAAFIDSNKVGADPEALRRIRSIAKKHARKCLEDYGKVNR